MSKNWKKSWLWKSSRYASSFIARKALRWTRILTRVDQRSKTTSHYQRYSDTMQHRELRSDRGSWFINEFFLKLAFFNIHDTFKAGNWSSYVFLKFVYLNNHDIFNCVKWQCDSKSTVRAVWDRFLSSNYVKQTCWTERTGRPVDQATQKSQTKDLLNSDIPEWLQEFRENLVDDNVPEHRHSHASSSHEPSLEPMPARSVDLGKHSVYTHFPKDRYCEICKRTKITRAPCRRRNGEAVARAEILGDLITAEHKVLSERLWISKQSSICSRGAGLGHPMDPIASVQNKNFSGNTKELAKVLGAE